MRKKKAWIIIFRSMGQPAGAGRIEFEDAPTIEDVKAMLPDMKLTQQDDNRLWFEV